MPPRESRWQRGELVSDCCVLWLRFVAAADVDAYCAVDRSCYRLFRGLRLAVSGCGAATPRGPCVP